jgi:Fe-S oxidoreductase
MSKKIAYFVGCAANYIDPEVGEATVGVLQDNGLRPILTDQKCCATPKLAGNDVKGFLRNAEFNVCALHKTNSDIVTACTSCALTIKRDYPRILGGAKAQVVAKRTHDIMEYLALLETRKVLKTTFRSLDLKLLYHSPCHLRALGNELIEERLRLMRKIPGITIESMDRGCCGMGGTFGFKSRFYKMSMKIGGSLFEEIMRISPDMIVTECPTCKMQIEHGTGMKVVHPIIIVKQAYEV